MSVSGIAKASRVRPVSLRLPPIPSIRDILKIYKLNALKHLSQNFLLDEKVINKIVNAAGSVHNCHVLEVGPGPGGITRSILAKGASKVYLIEKDRRFEKSLKLLEEIFPDKLLVNWGDVLSYNLTGQFPDDLKCDWAGHSPYIHIIGNLPFSISTPLIIRYLRSISKQEDAWSYGRVPMTLTFQKEVGERMVADIMDSQRSRLSIMCQYLCEVFYKFTISGNAFVPKPDVDVAVVKFIPRKVPLIRQPVELVEKVVRHAFSMTQKKIRKPLSTLFPKPIRGELTDRLFYYSGQHYETKSAQLGIDDFSDISDAYARICQEHPGLYHYNYRGKDPDQAWLEVFGHHEANSELISRAEEQKHRDQLQRDQQSVSSLTIMSSSSESDDIDDNDNDGDFDENDDYYDKDLDR